ncbi:MAG TPA: HAMP domain-containing sensor histidine kinase [Kineosporiaceae bacterium]
MTGPSLQARAGIQARLVLGNLLLVVISVAVTWAVAALVGPSLFRRYISNDEPLDPGALDRAEDAFHVANLLQAMVTTSVVILLTTVTSLFIARAIGRSVRTIATTATEIAAGRLGSRVPLPQPVPELDTLATAINELGHTIGATEATRRRLLTDLAHELRTPLATMDGYLQAIEDGLEAADSSTLAVLRGQVRRITRLADDINAVSAADEGRLAIVPRPASVGAISRDAVRAAQPSYAEKNVRLTTEGIADARAAVDPERIGQVLTNLLSNALRHTPPEGSVTLGLAATGREVVLTVRDSGEGIPAQHVPHVFERFYRAAPRNQHDGQGSGVGLTISRAIVIAHGGSITVDSPGAGRGTTVTLTLPRIR